MYICKTETSNTDITEVSQNNAIEEVIHNSKHCLQSTRDKEPNPASTHPFPKNYEEDLPKSVEVDVWKWNILRVCVKYRRLVLLQDCQFHVFAIIFHYKSDVCFSFNTCCTLYIENCCFICYFTLVERITHHFCVM